MSIKNLSQLKKAIAAGQEFIIKNHFLRPSFSGQHRKPNVVQTNGFYSIDPDDQNNPINFANDGRGFWFAYGKAADWIFENDTCKCIVNGRPIWEIVFCA